MTMIDIRVDAHMFYINYTLHIMCVFFGTIHDVKIVIYVSHNHLHQSLHIYVYIYNVLNVCLPKNKLG